MRAAPVLASLSIVALSTISAAQGFAHDTLRIPSAGFANATPTENVEFADFDGDGDVDVALADGGDFGNERNRVWINLGGAQAGAMGWFADESAVRAPAVLDSSRDIDFIDLDSDGDSDLYVSNSSTLSNQSGRWWINMGGLQGGSPGYFTDQTATRWLGLGVNNGVGACSSIAPQFVLASGGFIDWSCDSAIADLDLDGALDLVQATYGPASTGRTPTRVFLGDGQGRFREFNPSCAQLTTSNLLNGSAALWCEGVHFTDTTDTSGAEADITHEALAIELGDLDGDFDVDLLHGDKFRTPRVFDNRWSGAALAWRDITHAIAVQSWAPGPGNYEQELGDMDGDGSLDVYGVNWVLLEDAQLFNRGDGTFDPGVVVPQSIERQIDAELVDHDNDGDLDAFVVSESIEDRIYANPGAAGAHLLALDPGAVPIVVGSGQGVDARDLDGDGDADVLVATIYFEPDTLYVNLAQTPDTHAPRVTKVEQAPDRQQSSTPTSVGALVYDNAAWSTTAAQHVELEHFDASGVVQVAPMRWSGGQVFRGLIPGAAAGVVSYRVVARDEQGNAGASAWRSFTSDCTGIVSTYCSAKLNSQGCTPTVEALGTPSASVLAPFRIRARNVLNNKLGLLFYGFAPDAAPFQGGHLCVQQPLRRTPVQDSEGNLSPDDCSGLYSFDFNHHIRSGIDPLLGPGVAVYAQYWSRDPASPSTTGLTNAVSFVICP
ncbi:MAG: VCBS repeat-containing protein [Planctomycetes bacterium]|nr:VCBS repeat-containing protein [Planctomycetota bacterium]